MNGPEEGLIEVARLPEGTENTNVFGTQECFRFGPSKVSRLSHVATRNNNSNEKRIRNEEFQRTLKQKPKIVKTQNERNFPQLFERITIFMATSIAHTYIVILSELP